jgi:hypothetical protein
VEAGVKCCREEISSPSMTLADTSPGQKIIRTIMAEFVHWLTDAQEVTTAGLVSSQGQPRDWNLRTSHPATFSNPQPTGPAPAGSGHMGVI